MNRLPNHLLQSLLSKLNTKNTARLSSVSKEMKNKTKPSLAATKIQRAYKDKLKIKRSKDQLKHAIQVIKAGKNLLNRNYRNQRNFPPPNNMNNNINYFINNSNENKLFTKRQKIVLKYILLDYLVLSEVDLNEYPVPNFKSNVQTFLNITEKEARNSYDSLMETYTNNFEY
jgi:hypothetical protein